MHNPCGTSLQCMGRWLLITLLLGIQILEGAMLIWSILLPIILLMHHGKGYLVNVAYGQDCQLTNWVGEHTRMQGATLGSADSSPTSL